MTWGEKIAFGVSAFWVVAVFGFMFKDLVNGLRSRKMSYITTTGTGTSYPYSQTTSTSTQGTSLMAETIHSGGKLHLNGHGVVWQKPNGNEVDISKAAEIFWFFLAQHPEIVEQFNAIEKIKES
jgi:hypothetical protein